VRERRVTMLSSFVMQWSHEMGRPPIRKKGAFTAAERQARRRKKLRREAREMKRVAKSAKTAQSSRTKMRKYARLTEWKRYARGLLEAAVRDAQCSAVYEHWWATALSAAAGMDDDVATEMFRRLAIALEIVIDMRGWPAGLVRRVTA
jgi:hypothetical protein